MRKNLVLFVCCLFSVLLSLAQTSENGFSFQGYAIDPEGKALSSENITVRFTVYNTGGSGSYQEEQELTSDNYGVFIAIVGAKNLAAFKQLNFTAKDAAYNLKVEVKKTAGGSYTTISDAPMQAVPYARFAYNGVPVGTVVPFCGPSTKVPDGWLICDGSSLDGSSAEYAQLFSVIGTAWGGSGTNFRLPDMRGMFLRGVNGNRSDGYADPDNTRAVGSVQVDAIQSHNHTGTTNPDGDHSHDIQQLPYDSNGSGQSQQTLRESDGSDENWGAVKTPSPNGAISTDGEHTHTFTTGNTGGSETRPNNVAVYYIIKY